LIEAWASLKSFVRKDGADQKKVDSGKDDDPGNPAIDFHGEKRSNQTHQSATDPEAVLYRKAKGKESKLCFGAHVLMENRHGLCAAIDIHDPIAQSEPDMALAQIDEHTKLHAAEPQTVSLRSIPSAVLLATAPGATVDRDRVTLPAESAVIIRTAR
jgi:hypothetical protein